ncbi:erythromycin esterase family protein [Nocardia rhamnosiphila]|uniref:Erythromycin esterase family protein n=1 Tax=Nocardia rhamnosiphila TaxID=426716 RepID=A0ABV2WR95_9NOCA
MRPVLEPLTDYLCEVDPGVVHLARRALDIDDRIKGTSHAAVAPRWAELPTAEQTALTAALARLSVRLRALEPLYVQRGGRHRYDLAAQRLAVAVHAEYMFPAIHGVFDGTGLPADASARDRLMADSLHWHRAHLDDPGARIVPLAHNNHIQKTPAEFDGVLALYPLGHYLATELCDDYRTMALTHTAASVPASTPTRRKSPGSW